MKTGKLWFPQIESARYLLRPRVGPKQVAVNEPSNLDNVPPVGNRAVSLAATLAAIDLTKFRFMVGCALIGAGIVIFFLGHLLAVAKYFTPDFTDRSWTLTKWLLPLGVAFAGKEVTEALGSAVKSLWKSN
jgi:hypothetical protein